MDIKNAKTKIIIALFALCALVLTSCSTKSAEPYTGQSFFFDTVCSITVYGMDEADAKAAVDAAFDECGKLEGILSKTIEGSDIYNINHSGTEGAEVSDQTLELIRAAIAYGDESSGSFDCTIGPAEALYDFHEEEHQIPTEEQLADAVEKVDYKQISIDGSKVTLGIPGAEIDLGGIGKGYAADIAADCLAEHGVTSGLISLGGNIVTIGDKQGSDFKIGIEKPFSHQSELVGVVTTSDSTLVTSGIYERYFEADGKIYHHILDPSTGLPADTDIAGVTVVSSLGHSMDCDAMSTICLLLGKEKALEYIEGKDGYEAIVVDRDGNVTKTSGMTNFAE